VPDGIEPGRAAPGFEPARSDGFGLTMATALARQAMGRLTATSTDGRVELSVCFTLLPDLGPAGPG